MVKFFNKYLNLSIIISVISILFGLVIVIWPNISLDVIAYIIACFLIVYGSYNFIESFTINPLICLLQMTTSILSMMMGIIIFLNPDVFEKIIPIVLGITFIISGFFKTRISFVIKNVDSSWYFTLGASILMIICGFVLIINPKISALMLTTIIGTLLIIYSISGIIDTIIFKKKIKDITKYFDKLLK